jgi:hypothetical protein
MDRDRLTVPLKAVDDAADMMKENVTVRNILPSAFLSVLTPSVHGVR